MSLPTSYIASLQGGNPVTPWLTQVNQLNFSYDPSVAGSSGAALAGLNSQFPNAATTMAAWNDLNPNPATQQVFPRTWNAFITALGGDPTTSGPALQGFMTEYQQILQTTSGDWQGLSSVNLQTQFENSFNQFLSTFTFSSTGDAGPPSYFVQQWEHFMTVGALQQSANATGAYTNVTSFQQIYNAFFPNNTQAQYQTYLSNFVNKIINDPSNPTQYYLPSQFVQEFYTAVQNTYLSTRDGADSANGNNGPQLSIIWKVFALVVSMIGVIQNVAAAYAGRLTAFSNWDSAYTSLIANIPVFTVGDSSPFSGNDSSSASTRQELNNLNQTLSQNLQGYRSLVENTEKNIQSTVNNMNDAVNTQANLGTSLLQEMQTILSSMFH